MSSLLLYTLGMMGLTFFIGFLLQQSLKQLLIGLIFWIIIIFTGRKY